MKFSHLGIYVKDLYPMQLFYRKILGFKEEYSYVSKNTPGLKTLFLKRGKLCLELLHYSDKRLIAKKGNSNFHLSLTVKDVDGEALRLKKMGIALLKGPRTTGDGYRELEIKDPEHNIIEISCRVKAFPGYPIKAVLFDLDGTVIDSEDNYYEADRLLLAPYGLNFTREMKKGYVGMGNHAMMADLKSKFKIPATIKALLAKKNRIYLKLALENTCVFKNMLKLINKLYKKQIPLTLASGSSPEILIKIISSLKIGHYFKAIVSAEDVGKSKPHPDLFLATAQRLGIDPLSCLVIEDSQYGVEAAKRAFMRCIAIPSVIEDPLDDAFYAADLLFRKGMQEFNYKKVYRWIKKRRQPRASCP
jgi:HAD superfamily hydrolase (TIGR01509 family)